jgi:hypothetical protein
MFKNILKVKKEQADFAAAAQRMLQTEDGRKVFAMLKKDYIDRPLVDTDTHITYFKLGQSELIKALLKYATEVDITKIEEQSVINSFDLDELD